MAETTSETKFDIKGILYKVQMLFAKADDSSVGPEEAALFRNKAEQLMIKYRIDAAEAAERDTGSPLKPAWSSVWLGKPGEWTNYMLSFAQMAASHTGVRLRAEWKYASDGSGYEGLVCGFSHDVAFFELLYTSIIEAFSSRLEPKYRADETLEANALRLRQGGMERARIARLLFASKPAQTVNEQKAQNRRVTNMIKKEAERIGQPELAEAVLGRGFNAKTYRASYAQGFHSEIWSRLWTLRAANPDSGLVLKSAKERVDEAWYERFPDERPKPFDPDSLPASASACEKCKKAKSGACRDHRMRAYKERPFNRAAASQGRSAARTIDLNGSVRGKALS